MKALKLITVAGILAVGLSAVASAKPISRIIAESGLSPDDFNILTATTDAMLESGAPRVGEESSWTSADTGSKGTVRVREIRDNCVHLQHFIQPDGSDQTRELRTRRCRDADGNWIVTP